MEFLLLLHIMHFPKKKYCVLLQMNSKKKLYTLSNLNKLYGQGYRS